MEMAQGEVTYTVDAEDFVISFNVEWTRFAEDNESPDLADIGQLSDRSIIEFVESYSCKTLYTMLLARVRTTQETVSIPFRCDAPHERRFMKMVLSPLTDGSVVFKTTLLKAEARDFINLLSIDREKSEGMIVVCSWCNKVEVDHDNGQWREVEEAIKILGLMNDAQQPPVTHGCCSACYQSISAKINFKKAYPQKSTE
jgi:hypothetical protein